LQGVLVRLSTEQTRRSPHPDGVREGLPPACNQGR